MKIIKLEKESNTLFEKLLKSSMHKYTLPATTEDETDELYRSILDSHKQNLSPELVRRSRRSPSSLSKPELKQKNPTVTITPSYDRKSIEIEGRNDLDYVHFIKIFANGHIELSICEEFERTKDIEIAWANTLLEALESHLDNTEEKRCSMRPGCVTM
jgi:hypothetical protein